MKEVIVVLVGPFTKSLYEPRVWEFPFRSFLPAFSTVGEERSPHHERESR